MKSNSVEKIIVRSWLVAGMCSLSICVSATMGANRSGDIGLLETRPDRIPMLNEAEMLQREIEMLYAEFRWLQDKIEALEGKLEMVQERVKELRELKKTEEGDAPEASKKLNGKRS